MDSIISQSYGINHLSYIYIYIYIYRLGSMAQSGVDGSVGQPKASKPEVPGSTPGSS